MDVHHLNKNNQDENAIQSDNQAVGTSTQKPPELNQVTSPRFPDFCSNANNDPGSSRDHDCIIMRVETTSRAFDFCIQFFPTAGSIRKAIADCFNIPQDSFHLVHDTTIFTEDTLLRPFYELSHTMPQGFTVTLCMLYEEYKTPAQSKRQNKRKQDEEKQKKKVPVLEAEIVPESESGMKEEAQDTADTNEPRVNLTIVSNDEKPLNTNNVQAARPNVFNGFEFTAERQPNDVFNPMGTGERTGIITQPGLGVIRSNENYFRRPPSLSALTRDHIRTDYGRTSERYNYAMHYMGPTIRHNFRGIQPGIFANSENGSRHYSATSPTPPPSQIPISMREFNNSWLNRRLMRRMAPNSEFDTDTNNGTNDQLMRNGNYRTQFNGNRLNSPANYRFNRFFIAEQDHETGATGDSATKNYTLDEEIELAGQPVLPPPPNIENDLVTANDIEQNDNENKVTTERTTPADAQTNLIEICEIGDGNELIIAQDMHTNHKACQTEPVNLPHNGNGDNVFSSLPSRIGLDASTANIPIDEPPPIDNESVEPLPLLAENQKFLTTNSDNHANHDANNDDHDHDDDDDDIVLIPLLDYEGGALKINSGQIEQLNCAEVDVMENEDAADQQTTIIEQAIAGLYGESAVLA